jgi:Secretion system C-terminal sorting domain
MVRNLLLSIFCLVSISMSAQISVSPNPLSINVVPTGGDVKYEIFFTNSQDTVYNIYWQIVKDASFPAQWTTFVCDLVLCYGDNVDKSSNTKPNEFTKGTHKFEFHINPNGVAASAGLTFKLFTEKNQQGEIFSTPIAISSPSSVKDANIGNIKVYPNPTSEDYFQIANSSNVNKVVLYNLFGKEVKSYFHYNDARHEIGDLKSGIYVVKLIDSKGRLIKSIKLNKIYGGA